MFTNHAHDVLKTAMAVQGGLREFWFDDPAESYERQ